VGLHSSSSRGSMGGGGGGGMPSPVLEILLLCRLHRGHAVAWLGSSSPHSMQIIVASLLFLDYLDSTDALVA
jgi:hypothetical protein